jgi:hypothetical protein
MVITSVLLYFQTLQETYGTSEQTDYCASHNLYNSTTFTPLRFIAVSNSVRLILFTEVAESTLYYCEFYRNLRLLYKIVSQQFRNAQTDFSYVLLNDLLYHICCGFRSSLGFSHTDSWLNNGSR